MAPRSRLLDLERHDVLFFYDDGVYHQFQSNNLISVATHGIVFWPVFLVAALLLHLVVKFQFQHAAAVCVALYVAYCFVLDRAAQASTSSSWPSTAAAVPPAEPSRGTVPGAGYTVEQKSL